MKKPVEKSIQVWTVGRREELKDCFDVTDCEAFFDSCRDPHELTDSIASYIQFFEDTVINTETVRVFPNNKPWVSQDLKICLNERKFAFLKGDTDAVKENENEFRSKIWNSKKDFKDKVEQRFCTENPRQTWERLNAMMGGERKIENNNMAYCSSFVNDLNCFMEDLILLI